MIKGYVVWLPESLTKNEENLKDHINNAGILKEKGELWGFKNQPTESEKHTSYHSYPELMKEDFLPVVLDPEIMKLNYVSDNHLRLKKSWRISNNFGDQLC